MSEKFSNWVLRWRVAIILATVLIVAGIATGARFIQFSNDYRVYFSADNPQLLAFEALQNVYSKTDNVLFAIAPQDGQVFSRKTLANVGSDREQDVVGLGIDVLQGVEGQQLRVVGAEIYAVIVTELNKACTGRDPGNYQNRGQDDRHAPAQNPV